MIDQNIAEVLITGGGLIAIFGAVIVNNNMNTKKVSRVYERLDECKTDTDKKFQSKEVCNILQEQLSNDIKEKIRLRDNNECQYCFKTSLEHIQEYGQKLHVHHIDYDKTNCEEENLITLCISCNVKANYQREYWESYFKEEKYAQNR